MGRDEWITVSARKLLRMMDILLTKMDVFDDGTIW